MIGADENAPEKNNGDKHFLHSSMSKRISGGVLAIFSARIKKAHTLSMKS